MNYYGVTSCQSCPFGTLYRNSDGWRVECGLENGRVSADSDEESECQDIRPTWCRLPISVVPDVRGGPTR